MIYDPADDYKSKTYLPCQNNRELVPWWRHQMETFSALLVICAGNSPVTGEFPTQRPVTQKFDVFFDLRMNNGWVNNHGAGDLRRHQAHCYVTVMLSPVALAFRYLVMNQVVHKANLFVFFVGVCVGEGWGPNLSF